MEVVDFTTFQELHRLVRERVGSRGYAGISTRRRVGLFTVGAVEGKINSGADGADSSGWCGRRSRGRDQRLDPEIVLTVFK